MLGVEALDAFWQGHLRGRYRGHVWRGLGALSTNSRACGLVEAGLSARQFCDLLERGLSKPGARGSRRRRLRWELTSRCYGVLSRPRSPHATSVCSFKSHRDQQTGSLDFTPRLQLKGDFKDVTHLKPEIQADSLGIQVARKHPTARF